MLGVNRLTATVSAKGRIILPKSILQARRWEAGTRLVVENGPEGVLLRISPKLARNKYSGVSHTRAKRSPLLK